MKTFILFWNPAISSYKLDDFQRELEELHDDYCNMNWSVWEHEKASAGDRFFMVRCGNGNTGICMSGYFSSDPYQDEDWSGRGRVTYYMDLEPDAMIHPDYRPILPTSDLVKAIRTTHAGRLLIVPPSTPRRLILSTREESRIAAFLLQTVHDASHLSGTALTPPIVFDAAESAPRRDRELTAELRAFQRMYGAEFLELVHEFESVAQDAVLSPAERNARLARCIVHAFLNLRSEED